MRRIKVASPVEVEKRPEPEGQGDWLYICTSCGYRRKADVTFCENCPRCHGSRWSAYWLEKPAQQQENKGNKPVGQGITPTTELLPLNRAEKPKPGPKIPPVPDDLIKKLAGQGLGCKAISSKLRDEGITISHTTIQRRLQSRLL